MYILFDIGGSKMRVAGSSDLKEMTEPLIEKTPPSYEEGMKQFIDLIDSCAQGKQIDGICGGIAGPLSEDRKTLVASPHLADWVEKPFRSTLHERYNAPVYIENDAALVGLGEATAGAGVDANIVAYITVSTGVGGARIINQQIDEHSRGFEPGHQIIDLDESACDDCRRGTLQAYVSGMAIKERFETNPEDLSQDDPVWNELAEWLSVGVSNTILHWSPDVVVLGGAMIIGDPAILLEVVERRIKETLDIYTTIPEIRKAKLEHIGGLYGAQAYLRARI